MRYALGIDGGATKTLLTAVDENKNVIFERRGKSCNVASLPYEVVDENLSELITGFFEESGFATADCAGVCLGAAGAGRASAEEKLTKILSKFFPVDRISVTDDAAGTLMAGIGGGDGVLLVSGTGSICRGVKGGRTVRVGGWGHVMSDEGSGYDMGRRILTAVMRSLDGRDGPTELTKPVLEKLGATDANGVVDAVYSPDFGKTQIADLARFCDGACEKGDKAALKIIDECAEGLAELVMNAAKIFGEGETVQCVCSGSLLEKSRFLKEKLEEKLSGFKPHIVLTQPKLNVSRGFAELAVEKFMK